MEKKTKKTVCICPYCLEALRSRGEKFKAEQRYFDSETDDPRICWWCDEDIEDGIYYEAEL